MIGWRRGIDVIHTGTLAERMKKYTTQRGPDECWLWIGCVDRHGYGRIGVWRANDGQVFAHWAAWALANNATPCGWSLVRHLVCDNPPCVNPNHLAIGTDADNVRDMDSKGRRCVLAGEDAPSARLTVAQIVEIRARRSTGEAQAELARAFGVDPSHISKIISGAKWRSVC